MTTAFGPQGPNYTTTRPPFDPLVSAGVDTFFKNCSAAGATDGTYATADFFNVVLANLRALVRGGGVTLDGTNDNMVLQAVQAIANAAAAAVQTNLTSFAATVKTYTAGDGLLLPSGAPTVFENAVGKGVLTRTASLDALTALVGTWSGDTGHTVESSLYEFLSSGIEAGANVTLTHDGATGKLMISSTASGGGGGDGNMLAGTGAPSNTSGQNGDWWYDVTNARIYGPKASGVWPGSYYQLATPPAATSYAQYALQGGPQTITANVQTTANMTAVQNQSWASIASGVVTINQAGNYTVDCQIFCSVGASNGDYVFANGYLFMNGSNIALVTAINISGPGNSYNPASGGNMTRTLYVAAGTTFWISATADNDEFTETTVQISSATMNITKVG